ncbi:RidA family protein [Ruegeria arenilitoris]|uniref:RidA family protein n=1 Tax=Ruegeria arenilitoris TaxID=1173585 RepID=UPI00147B803D|nr:RidA family protein [Ruegeria arenilitoris]
MTQALPIPQGHYIPAKRHGATIYSSGMTPRVNGKLMATGPVRADAVLEDYREAVVLACENALAAVRSQLREGEKLGCIVSLTVFIAAETGFTAHAKLADFASLHLQEVLGADGVGARAAIGVATLPGNAPVEVQLVAAI